MSAALSRWGGWLTLLAACGPSREAQLARLHGPRLVQALPRPSFTLRRLDGSPYDFRAETRGALTLLFFGYTNCPDVCPLHLANLSWAIHGLSPEQRRGIRMVFVTTDPERDTPERLRSWLSQFDSSFVGLTGTPAALDSAQRAVGMPPAFREGELPKGGYGIAHAAQIWAVTPDDSVHVLYPWGVPREQLAADLVTLLKLWPPRT